MEYRMDFVRLLTSKYNEMWSFYTETMGMKPRFNAQDGVYEEFVTPDATLAIYDKKTMIKEMGNEIRDSQQSSNDSYVIILKVDNVDQVYNELTKKGVKFVAPPTDRKTWVIRTAHLRDPDDNLIELNQPLEN